MKAVTISKHGGPEVLKYEDVPKPEVGPKGVLVEIRACALNHLDIWTREGMVGVDIPLPMIPGSDVSGVVAEIGAEVSEIEVGTDVVIAPGLSCGECRECKSGQDNICSKYSIIGFRKNGGCAEYVSVPEENVFPMPENLTYVEAASVPLVFLTAWHMLVARAKVRPGEDVLINSAGSGVGSAAIQIAKLKGARVIATTGNDEKCAKALEMGADDVINYTKKDFFTEVRRLTKNKGVEIVIEHVGKVTWKKSLLSLVPSGRFVTCGATTGSAVKFDLRYLFSRHLSILGSYMGTKEELGELLPYFSQGKLRPVVDRVYSLKDAASAHKYLDSRKHFGKVVLTPRTDSKRSSK